MKTKKGCQNLTTFFLVVGRLPVSNNELAEDADNITCL